MSGLSWKKYQKMDEAERVPRIKGHALRPDEGDLGGEITFNEQDGLLYHYHCQCGISWSKPTYGEIKELHRQHKRELPQPKERGGIPL